MSALSQQNNKRIAKNTLLLYFRMLFSMGIGLFTSRIVLESLGIEDYGIYNLVGGIVTIFAFLNSAMIATSQRFISYELGKEIYINLKMFLYDFNYTHSYCVYYCCFIGSNRSLVPQYQTEYSIR